MDESLYRGFDERARVFFEDLQTNVGRISPNRAVLKKRFTDEGRSVLHLGKRDVNELKKSFNVAFWAYRKVMRRDGEAYVFHPLRGALVMTWAQSMFGISDVTLIHIALLHDSYEETDTAWVSQAAIRSIVYLGQGSVVAQCVLHLTRTESESGEGYLFRLSTSKDWRALLAKVVDRIDNIWTLDAKDPERSWHKIRETETWFPRLEQVLKEILTEEQNAQRLNGKWFELVTFLFGYLRYAVAEKKREFGIS
jgi:(p)ppGpp synthase/HD superfamily hydrolase